VIAIDERSDEQLLQATASNPEAYVAFYRGHVRARPLNALHPRL
jgi:hypothetical protein